MLSVSYLSSPSLTSVSSPSETNRPFPSCCGSRYESEAKCKAFRVKINFAFVCM